MTTLRMAYALQYLGEDLIADAAAPVQKRKRPWLKWGSIAACILLILGVVLRVSIAFIPSQSTGDAYHQGIAYPLESPTKLPAEYPEPLLVAQLPLSENVEIELYYQENGSPQNFADWNALSIFDSDSEYSLSLYCMFGETDIEAWKVDMVFTEEATEYLQINGVRVAIARQEPSLRHAYWYYAIFSYGNVVYDLRVQSEDPDMIHSLLQTMLQNA